MLTTTKYVHWYSVQSAYQSVYQIDSPFSTEYYKINRYLRKMNDKLDKTFLQTILIAMLLYFNVINININMNIRSKNFPQIKACIL